MDRKDYLELCRLEAMEQNTQKVIFDNAEYRPKSYTLQFDKNGKALHFCVIKDKHSNTELHVKLQDLRKADGTG